MSHKCYNIGEININKTKAKLIYISSARYEGNWHSTTHIHPFTELFYVIKGKGAFIIKEESFDVKEDDLIIVDPNVEHTEVSKDNSPLEYIVLGIEGLVFSSNTKELAYNYKIYNYKNYKHEVLFYLQALLTEVENKEKSYKVICQNLLEILIINIIRRTDYALSIRAPQKMNKECAIIKRHINANFTNNITLDSLAKLTHMNKYYLVHTFKKTTGVSPISYLINRRIKESKILLETTNHSIGEIAEFLNFSSQSYFSQSFRKNTNKTPSQYRKEAISLH